MVEPPQAWNQLKPGGYGLGNSARHFRLFDETATSYPQANWQDEGYGEGLRRTRGEAVGEKLGTAPVNRHTLNMGTVSAPPSLPFCLSDKGQARCRLRTPRWDGGSVVVRGWESQPHGEGTQQDRRAVAGIPGGRR